MKCIEIVKFGAPEVLCAAERAVPVPGAGELLIRVAASGVNRPDVLQRKGFRLAGERRLGSNRYQWFYWNPSTRQCVEIRTRGDDVESLKEAEEYACN